MTTKTVIGVIGTAKNTGKTTTLSCIMQQAYQQSVRVGLTGIGYDGEEIDNITLLPKPRLFLEQGTIATTSENCLRTSTVHYEILKRTGIKTALGEVLVLKIIHPGLLVIAGPNKKSALQTVVSEMRGLDCELLLIDGSLNRLAPLAIADKLIFTTGASRNTNIDFLVEEMTGIQHAFAFGKSPVNFPISQSVSLLDDSGDFHLTTNSLLDDADLSELKSALKSEIRYILIPNLIASHVLRWLIDRVQIQHSKPIELVLTDPLKLLLSDEPLVLRQTLSAINNLRFNITYLQRPELAAITINPFYPRESNHGFTPEYIDKDDLMRQMKNRLSIPVFNVKDGGAERLFELCLT